MSRLAWAGLAAVLIIASPSFAINLAPNGTGADPKPRQQGPKIGTAPPPGVRIPGDRIETPLVVLTLPFMETRSTCGFADDYDEECPYPATAPDVVYGFIAPTALYINIELCGSIYDTKLFVYDTSYTPGFPFACNEDICGAEGYRSELAFLSLQAGHAYYIVVDGYGSACGQYTIAIERVFPGSLICPPGSVPEGEPVCQDEYVDQYNNGCCCGTPSHFTSLESVPGTLTVCGQSGSFFRGLEFNRDTDWYEINPADPTTLTYCVTAEFPVQIVLIDGRDGCEGYIPLDSRTALPWEEACITRNISPGRYWLWVGPWAYTPVVCGSDYVLQIDGYHRGGSDVRADFPARESALALFRHPEPTAGETAIRYEIPASSEIRLAVYGPEGRFVRALFEGEAAAGRHEVAWDGRDAAGHAVASGSYYCVLQVGSERRVERLTLLR